MRRCLFLLPLFVVLFLTACRSTPRVENPLTRYEYTQPEMGLPFRIVFYAPSKEKADAAAAAAFQRVADLNAIMSDYEMDSELSRLSHTSGKGTNVVVSADLWTVLERAYKVSKVSDGGFDITVGPVVQLWRKARRDGRMPDPTRLAEARKAVGYQKMKLDSAHHAVTLLAPGMKLDLGGIAKGYAIDQALQTLAALGVTRALVSGGGDMAAGDPPPGKAGWRIELAPLDVTNAPPARYVLIKHRGLATSGDLFQRVEIDGKRYSHIVDPHTGIGLTDHSLVTVIGPDCMTSDSLTKVVSVLGPEKGIGIIEATPDVAARVARMPDATVQLYESSRFGRYYAPVE